MTRSGSSNSVRVTLDELIAVNDEIIALVRSGVPLEEGLGHLGGDLPGRLGQFATSLADRMGAGESLAEVLRDDAVKIPSVYRAVIEAGLRAGRLPAALESVARSSRRLAELRRVLTAALVYPLLVFLLAWGLFVFFVVKIAPVLLAAFEDFGTSRQGPLNGLVDWGESALLWGPGIPAAVLAVAGLWWILSARASLVEAGSARFLLGWMPWTGRLLRLSRTATVVEVLAMLVENEVPLHEGVVLAARTVGDGPTLRAAEEISAALERGQPLPATRVGGAFSPFLSWLMATGQRRGTLLSALEHASEMYRRKAQRQADVARLLLPVALTLLIGGTVTVLYSLLLFLPWSSFLHEMSQF